MTPTQFPRVEKQSESQGLTGIGIFCFANRSKQEFFQSSYQIPASSSYTQISSLGKKTSSSATDWKEQNN